METLFVKCASSPPSKTSGSFGCLSPSPGITQHPNFDLYAFACVYHYILIYSFSDVFGDGQNKILVEGRVIKAFCLFKKGIQPRWEDTANKTGSELVASKSYSPEVLDVFWENLVMGLIGETIDEGDEICGCRVVNQTRKGKPKYKIELLLRTTDEPMGLKIKSKLSDL